MELSHKLDHELAEKEQKVSKGETTDIIRFLVANFVIFVNLNLFALTCYMYAMCELVHDVTTIHGCVNC